MRPILAVLLVLALAGCASSDKARMFPPSASVQELRTEPDGRWVLTLRVQNFARVAMRLSALEATLTVDGVEAARLSQSVDLAIAPRNAEPIEFVIEPGAAAAAALARALAERNGVGYTLEGRLRSSEPGSRNDPFRHESRLNPVPGLGAVLR